MSTNDNDAELYKLVNKAKPLGFFLTRARYYDPALGGGEFMLMRRREYPEQKNPWILKYATAQEVEDFLNKAANNYAA